MSNYEAIAAVTATIRHVIQAAIQDPSLPSSSAVSGATVTMVRPDTGGTGLPSFGVNIFLFQVTPNASLRNADAPTRRADGTLVKRPAAAVDLHYLFSFYGDDTQFQTQLLLGIVVATLHANPSLSRDQITVALADAGVAQVLSSADLADATDLVRLSPTSLSLEELSKLWSVMLQAPYVLSVIYQAGPLLLEDTSAIAGSVLPVLHKPVVRALATGSPVQPAIQAVLAQASGSSTPAPAPILLGYTLVLDGSYVGGASTNVLIDGASATGVTATGTAITLPLTPALGLRSGPHGIQVVQSLATGEPKVAAQPFTSNAAQFVLQPTIRSVTKSTSGATASVAVSLSPKVGKLQRVHLLLDELNPPASRPPSSYGVDAPLATADDQDPFIVPVPNIPSGTYLVRVQVDGAESLLDVDKTKGFTGPTVTL